MPERMTDAEIDTAMAMLRSLTNTFPDGFHSGVGKYIEQLRADLAAANAALLFFVPTRNGEPITPEPHADAIRRAMEAGDAR